MFPKTIFRAILAFLILVFSFLAWYFAYASFWHDSQNYIQRFFLPLISFLILGTLLGLWFLTENEKIFLWAGPALIFFPFLFIFSFSWIKLPLPWNFLTILIIFSAILFFAWGIRILRQEKEVRFKIVLAPVIGPGLKHVVTAMILLASIDFYFSPLAQLDIKEIFIPRLFFDSVFDPVLKTLGKGLLNNGLTNGAVKNQNLLPEITSQMEAQQKNISDQAYAMINQILANAGKPFKKYVPLGITLSFFFSLKVFEGIFLRLMIFGLWVIWKILRFFNIIKIKIAKVDKEVIEII